MAIYQFVIELLPYRWVEENKNTAINLLIKEDEYDTSIAWQEYSSTLSIDSLISKILPPNKSWHNDLKLWGEEEHHDIQVWRSEEQIESIRIRLDLRNNINSLKLKIVELSVQLKFYFYIPSMKKIIEPDVYSLEKAIQSSRAKKFVFNTDKFLDDLN